jgi:mannose-6-phosphate isomerase-like protein (cupin superfamily)
MSYTIRNLNDTEDQAPKYGFGEIGEAHFPREELGAETTGFAYHVLKPGKRQGFGHRHDKAEEVYVVVSGSGRVRLDDDVVELSPLDALRVAPQVARQFEAGPDGLSMLAFGPHHAGDGELVKDLWND